MRVDICSELARQILYDGRIANNKPVLLNRGLGQCYGNGLMKKVCNDNLYRIRVALISVLFSSNAFAMGDSIRSGELVSASPGRKPFSVVALDKSQDRPRSVETVYGKKKKPKPQCSDRKDNDGDGLKDYPRDPGCTSKKDNRERNPRLTPVVPPSGGLGPISFAGRRFFPADNPWNADISAAPVDPNSANLIASIGLATGLHPDFGTFYEGAPIGIPYTAVQGTQPLVPVSFDYADESDPGPYPIPPAAPIEGGASATGDRHILVVDVDHWVLYELFYAFKQGSGWHAGSGAVFDLNSNALRPPGWTSADAAGLPILPGLVRYDEVMQQGEITHALRFTVQRSRRAYVSPATHFASSNTSANLPPMGMRVRLKSSVDISGYPAPVQVILRALKRYGMFVADNGSNWFISGAHDPRWNDDTLSTIRGVKGQDFEVVEMGEIVTQ